MANQSYDRLARSLLDSSGREVSWPIVFAGVKNVVRADNLNNDTLTCMKGWLKSTDSQLLIPLLGLTVLHTISLNCSAVVRNQLATPKLIQRLEKQLARPQGPQVASALVQVLVDWAYLFGPEELGVRCQAVLDQGRYRQLAVGCGPSPAVLAMQEEMKLGLPPVAPIRGEDFVRWMYRGASLTDKSPGVAAGSSGGGGSGFADWPSVLSGGLPGGAPPTITTAAVPELCQRMLADAQRMTSALAACRAATRMQRQSELTAAMDAAYREAERCSQWRRVVQDFTQRCEDPRGLSAVLSATDVINQALQAWQHFTGHEVYHTLRITVPQPSAEMLRRTAAGSGTARHPGPGGRGSEVADLLGMGHVGPTAATTAPVLSTPNTAVAVASFQPQLPAPPQQFAVGGNPFGPARPFGGTPQLPAPSGNPFAAPAPAAARAGSQLVHVAAAQTAVAKDWDPFAPSPSEAPVQPKPPPPLAFAPPSSFAADAAANGGGSGGGNGWSAFPFDSPLAPSGVLWAGPQSPSLSLASPQASASALISPSAASAVSVASAASTPSGGVASGAAAQTSALSSPPQPPPAGVTYLQPFHDLLTPAAPAATPQQAATAAAAGSSSSGGGGSRQASVSATAGGGATMMSFSGHTASAVGTNPHPTNGHAYAYASSAAAGAAYPLLPTAGPSLSALTAAAPVAWTGVNRSSGSGDGAAPVLDWQPEFERLASELRSLWAASASASFPAMSPSPSSSSVAATAAAVAIGGGAAAAAPPLPAVLARVRGLCEALAAQHARHVAALAPQPSPASALAASLSEAAMLRDANSSGALKKLRDGAPALAAAGGPTAEGAGSQGSGSRVGPVAGAPGWVSFGLGGRAPQPVGPLQQHLMQQQQQHGMNGVVHGSGRPGAADLSLI